MPPPGRQRTLSRRRAAIESYFHVLHALMLRDMRTRFGGSHVGYAIVVGWPVAHAFMLVGIYTFRHMPAPIGDSRVLFFSTGAITALIFQYISREVMKAVLLNRPLTYYPQVKLIDVILARIIVEIMTGFLALLLTMSIVAALGVNPFPANPVVAITGYLAAILLGIAVGVVNVGIVSFFPAWQIGYILFTLVLYLSSGVIFLPNFMPQQIYDILKWNPVVQVVEWVRTGYYPELAVQVDYAYTILWSLTALLLGLMLERFVVRKRTT
ncbi:MAG: ABC transporter [Methylobacterium sp. CG08_land_8_20_14_0_20_71_15]|nr:MAG: ABC transporter [Methylobacterium sp. CG09_land_8_20_14_0_10_71_15]PIU12894.1 MAG: ABC transporter [Methylobacterium sp. CG08_land_8_20_14_0_20_71_15]GBU17511.1 capsular polysaccharide transport system permease protein [Methylobacterium sp.]